MTYSVTVSAAFEAEHVLTVPNAGPEGEPHTHRFGIDITFRGSVLSEDGYLLDIDEATDALAQVADRYRGTFLNDHLPGNPSCERLAAAIHGDICARIEASRLDAIEVAVHEDDTATVTFVGPP